MSFKVTHPTSEDPCTRVTCDDCGLLVAIIQRDSLIEISYEDLFNMHWCKERRERAPVEWLHKAPPIPPMAFDYGAPIGERFSFAPAEAVTS